MCQQFSTASNSTVGKVISFVKITDTINQVQVITYNCEHIIKCDLEVFKFSCIFFDNLDSVFFGFVFFQDILKKWKINKFCNANFIWINTSKFFQINSIVTNNFDNLVIDNNIDSIDTRVLDFISNFSCDIFTLWNNHRFTNFYIFGRNLVYYTIGNRQLFVCLVSTNFAHWIMLWIEKSVIDIWHSVFWARNFARSSFSTKFNQSIFLCNLRFFVQSVDNKWMIAKDIKQLFIGIAKALQQNTQRHFVFSFYDYSQRITNDLFSSYPHSMCWGNRTRIIHTTKFVDFSIKNDTRWFYQLIQNYSFNTVAQEWAIVIHIRNIAKENFLVHNLSCFFDKKTHLYFQRHCVTRLSSLAFCPRIFWCKVDWITQKRQLSFVWVVYNRIKFIQHFPNTFIQEFLIRLFCYVH